MSQNRLADLVEHANRAFPEAFELIADSNLYVFKDMQVTDGSFVKMVLIGKYDEANHERSRVPLYACVQSHGSQYYIFKDDTVQPLDGGKLFPDSGRTTFQDRKEPFSFLMPRSWGNGRSVKPRREIARAMLGHLVRFAFMATGRPALVTTESGLQPLGNEQLEALCVYLRENARQITEGTTEKDDDYDQEPHQAKSAVVPGRNSTLAGSSTSIPCETRSKRAAVDSVDHEGLHKAPKRTVDLSPLLSRDPTPQSRSAAVDLNETSSATMSVSIAADDEPLPVANKTAKQLLQAVVDLEAEIACAGRAFDQRNEEIGIEIEAMNRRFEALEEERAANNAVKREDQEAVDKLLGNFKKQLAATRNVVQTRRG